MVLSTCRLRSKHLGTHQFGSRRVKFQRKWESVFCSLFSLLNFYYSLLSFPFPLYLVLSDKANTPRLALREIITLPDFDQSHPDGELILIQMRTHGHAVTMVLRCCTDFSLFSYEILIKKSFIIHICLVGYAPIQCVCICLWWGLWASTQLFQGSAENRITTESLNNMFSQQLEHKNIYSTISKYDYMTVSYMLHKMQQNTNSLF